MKLLLTIFSILAVEAIQWEDCGDEERAVQFQKLQVQPETVRFGSSVTATAEIRVVKPVVDETWSKLEIWRILSIFGYDVDVKIGCYYGYGSCTRKLREVVTENPVLCEWYTKTVGRSCQLFNGNISSGNFSTHDLKTSYPDVKGITAYLLGGNYRVRWQWLYSDMTPFACFSSDFFVE